MAERSPYSLDRRIPFLFQVGLDDDDDLDPLAHVISLGWRYGTGGALQTPAASTTIKVFNGSTELTTGSVSIVNDRAEATFTPAATTTPGAGYSVRATPVFGSTTYPTVQVKAYMCAFVPQPVVDEAALIGGEGISELQYRVPTSQGAGGDNVGWQPQIDAAYHALLRRLIDREEPIWLLRSLTDYYEWCLTRALLNALQAVRHGLDDSWTDTVRLIERRHAQADRELRPGYTDQHARARRGGGGIRLAALGRPAW